MKLTTNAKLKRIGARAQINFCLIDFTVDASPMFSKVLPDNMTNEQIKAQLNPTEVTLGQLAAYLPQVTKGTQYLFYVFDATAVSHVVFAFYDESIGWSIVSPNKDEANLWRAGTLLLSKTAI